MSKSSKTACCPKEEEGVLQAAITQFPHPTKQAPIDLSDEEKVEYIQEKMSDILTILGFDLEDESLKETPYRIAKMYVKEIFTGLDPKNFPDITLVKGHFHKDDNHMVLVKDIAINSFCEHHLVPIHGKARIAYIPNEHVIGLSKLNRIAQYFSKRPQMQERLTAQIADSLAMILETEDVAVMIEAKHFCVAARGIQDQDSGTRTQVLRGRFKSQPELRADFFR